MILRYLVVACLLCTPFTVAADEARKIDFSTVLRGPDDEAFQDCKKTDDTGKCISYVDLTLARLCLIAAAMPDKSVGVAEQVAHGKLATKMVGAKEIALSVDEVKFLKDQIGKLGYNTMAVYQAAKLLDPTLDK